MEGSIKSRTWSSFHVCDMASKLRELPALLLLDLSKIRKYENRCFDVADDDTKDSTTNYAKETIQSHEGKLIKRASSDCKIMRLSAASLAKQF